MRKVLIGIQCRTQSERLPGKALLKVSGKTIIEHVVGKSISAAAYINRSSLNCRVVVRLLVPKNDMPLIELMSPRVEIVEGHEHDVLSRYIKAANAEKADLVVRITGDCLFVPSFSISRHIKLSLKHNLDYCSNTIERMMPEGFDTEVLSMDLLNYLDRVCNTGLEREHVTTKIPQLFQSHGFLSSFKMGFSREDIDLSERKTSIDTKEDYEKALIDFEKREEKISRLLQYGQVF